MIGMIIIGQTSTKAWLISSNFPAPVADTASESTFFLIKTKIRGNGEMKWNGIERVWGG